MFNTKAPTLPNNLTDKPLGPGTWGEWSDFEKCTQSCGGGNMTRVRVCLHPDGCPNEELYSTDTRPCNSSPCKFLIN